jgi:demethylmenaquinone methyltransferase/2-methoxy-6-polyprenyl-1,4-benzoquinol methylase
MTHPATPVVERMLDYYAQRAAYYERVYHKPERQHDLRAIEAWLPGAFAGRHVLEVACGTGWWTPHGARDAASWLATDLNPETMALARTKPLPACVRFATVDAYSWQGLPGPGACATDQAASAALPPPAAAGAPPPAAAGCFTAAFAGCWWSHVPLQRLPQWLASLHAHLAPGARVVFLDNSYVQTSNLPITHSDAEGNTYQTRTLDDGSVHEVLKNFPTPEQATAAIGPEVRQVQWLQHGHYWVLSYERA